MRSIIIFLFCFGVIMIIHSLYEQKFQSLKKNVRVEYRFIPRTYYEEQLSSTPVSSMFKNMFDKESPWFDRNVTLPKPAKGSDKKA
jgi:hypothetical protein